MIGTPCNRGGELRAGEGLSADIRESQERLEEQGAPDRPGKARVISRVGPFAVAMALTIATACSLAGPPGDGSLLRAAPRAPLQPFDALDEAGRDYFPRAAYEEARAQRTFDILDVRYASTGVGGSTVPGVLIRPKNPGGRKWPAIIYNRRGTGDDGRIDDLAIVDLYLLAKAGFVVIATDYRYHDALAKQDQWGGLDVEDVLSLFPLLRAAGTVDMDRVFMVGVARGGMMTYLALKRGAPVKAAAVVAGPSDLEALGAYRPELVNGDDRYDGWARVWPDYAHRSAEQYRERSAVYWAARITVPVLIVHAKDDQLVPLDQAVRMAAALQIAGRRYYFQVYLNDGHLLLHHRDARNRQVVEWFNSAASEQPRTAPQVPLVPAPSIVASGIRQTFFSSQE